MVSKLRKDMTRSDTCKCGHDIRDHVYAGCQHEVGSLCMTNECGGKCHKCKCKKFDAKIIKKKPTEIDTLRKENAALRARLEAEEKIHIDIVKEFFAIPKESVDDVMDEINKLIGVKYGFRSWEYAVRDVLNKYFIIPAPERKDKNTSDLSDYEY